jgi:DNA primase
MKIPDNTIEEIKNAVPIEDIIGEYVALSRKGDRLWGRCPFHQEKTPSFTVTPDKGLFYCFGCQKGGTVFTFLQEIENWSFMESVEFLARKGGIELQVTDEKDTSYRKKRIELNTKVSKSFHYILTEKGNAEGARSYLSERGIGREMIDRFTIGWAPADSAWLWNFLRSKHYSEDFLEASGFFSKNNRYPLFAGRIMFPIHSPRGEVIGFGGRTLQPGRTPKYINSPESDIFQKGKNLFGLNLAVETIRKEKRCLLVEGYTDVIALHQAGFTGAVAPLGTALTEKQAELLNRYADSVYFMFDGDEAGINATIKGVSLFERIGTDTFVIKLEKNKDPADILQQNGVQTLKNLLDYPINSFEYIMDVSFSKRPTNTPSGKKAACWDVFTYIENSTSEIKQEEYLKKLAEKSQIDIQSVWNDYNNTKKGVKIRKNDNTVGNRQRILPTDLYLMITAAINVDYFPGIRNQIEAKELDNREAKELFIALEEHFRRGTLSTQAVIDGMENEYIRKCIIEGGSKGEFSENIDSVIKDSIRQIKRKGLIKRQKNIFEQIRKAEQNEDRNVLRELLEEKIFIDDELKKSRVEGNVESAD